MEVHFSTTRFGRRTLPLGHVESNPSTIWHAITAEEIVGFPSNKNLFQPSNLLAATTYERRSGDPTLVTVLAVLQDGRIDVRPTSQSEERRSSRSPRTRNPFLFLLQFARVSRAGSQIVKYLLFSATCKEPRGGVKNESASQELSLCSRGQISRFVGS
jgi:hypothetical protein